MDVAIKNNLVHDISKSASQEMAAMMLVSLQSFPWPPLVDIT